MIQQWRWHRSKGEYLWSSAGSSTIINTAVFSFERRYKQITISKSYKMAEDLQIIEGTKEEVYQSLIPQIKGLLEGEEDLIANLANIAAALKEQFGWLWVGFYLVKPQPTNDILHQQTMLGDQTEILEIPQMAELVLGPFQGPVACTRIRKGRGVCGASWAEAKTLIVPDVEAFPGHIACSSLSRSEIVVPLLNDGEVMGVLDVDSSDLNTFDEVDKQYLEEIVALIQY
jgi:L-methionine (R)-S-oxide reductase